jgi:hypothetical protein
VRVPAVSERPDAVCQEHAQRHRRNRSEIRDDLARSRSVHEKKNEQTRRERACRLNANIENASPRRIVCDERPAPVEHVAVQRANGEPESCGDHVRRRDEKEKAVDDEADRGVSDADDEEARELRCGIIPPGSACVQSRPAGLFPRSRSRELPLERSTGCPNGRRFNDLHDVDEVWRQAGDPAPRRRLVQVMLSERFYG